MPQVLHLDEIDRQKNDLLEQIGAHIEGHDDAKRCGTKDAWIADLEDMFDDYLALLQFRKNLIGTGTTESRGLFADPGRMKGNTWR